MLRQYSKKDCCGCSACAEICPKHCIQMEADSEGFVYPNMLEGCISCGLCLKVCPYLSPKNEKRPKYVYAAYNIDGTIREKSSSGGIFFILAQKVILEKGVVFGVRFDKEWNAIFDYAENIVDVYPFLGSKYVQAKVGEAYKNVRGFLEQNRLVLFPGTSCQVAGLKAFLRKDYNNLVTVDVVCHGVPSPKVWKKYITQLKESNKQDLKYINFRFKKTGWKNFSFSYKSGSKSVYTPFWNNIYMKAFLSDIILRPSCYHCNFKQGKSDSDITIGDYWGIQYIKPKMDDDKGTSIILVNTQKGEKILNFGEMKVSMTSYEESYSMNPALVVSVVEPTLRTIFFSRFCEDVNVMKLMESLMKQSLGERIKCKIKLFKIRFLQRIE